MELGDNFVCPQCGEEGAYFEGLCYVCPDCDYEWGEIDEDDFEEEDDDDDDDDGDD